MGAQGLNSTLVSPLNDTIKPKVFGFEEIKMHELAERTLQVQKLITKYRVTTLSRVNRSQQKLIRSEVDESC